MFGCKHQWVKQSETVTESRLEQSNRLGYNIQLGGYALMHDAEEWFQRHHIVILTCTKCGKIHKEVTNI